MPRCCCSLPPPARSPCRPTTRTGTRLRCLPGIRGRAPGHGAAAGGSAPESSSRRRIRPRARTPPRRRAPSSSSSATPKITPSPRRRPGTCRSVCSTSPSPKARAASTRRRPPTTRAPHASTGSRRAAASLTGSPCPVDGATFAAMPFQLPDAKGMRVVLHVYPVTRDIQQALVVMQGIFFVEVKDDRIQIEQVYSIFNLGKDGLGPGRRHPEAPREVHRALGAADDERPGPRQRRQGQGTTSRHVRARQARGELPLAASLCRREGRRLRGRASSSRGRHESDGRSYGGREVRRGGFSRRRVQATTPRGRGCSSPKSKLRRDEPWTSLHVRLEGLPTPGPGKYIATGLAGLAVTVGLVFAFGGGTKPTRSSQGKGRRAELLAELRGARECAQGSGDVGPRRPTSARAASSSTRSPARSTPPDDKPKG